MTVSFPFHDDCMTRINMPIAAVSSRFTLKLRLVNSRNALTTISADQRHGCNSLHHGTLFKYSLIIKKIGSRLTVKYEMCGIIPLNFKKILIYRIGQRDPQLPQLFVSINDSTIIISKGRVFVLIQLVQLNIQGDVLAARCTMENQEKRSVSVGASGDDEMCNFYLMYWVNGDSNTLRDNTCYSPGPPEYYWTSGAGLNNIPKQWYTVSMMNTTGRYSNKNELLFSRSISP